MPRNADEETRETQQDVMWTGSVAILDILGMKGMWSRRDMNQILVSIRKIKEALKIDKQQSNDVFKQLKINDIVQSKLMTFSDSIIICCGTRDNESFQSEMAIPLMAISVANAFNAALDEGYLLRGAISYGCYITAERMVIGSATDDAAAWYEQSNWAGIHLTPSADYAIKQLALNNVMKEKDWSDLLTRYPVPLQDNKELVTYAVAWPIAPFLEITRTSKEDREKILLNRHKNLLACFSNNPVTIKDEIKYRNTYKFFNHINNHKSSVSSELSNH